MIGWYPITVRIETSRAKGKLLISRDFTAPGCKRIIVDPGYLSSLKRPNVNIRWDAIDRVVEGGIRLKTGEEVPLDIIIFGTGYSVVRFLRDPCVTEIDVPCSGTCRSASAW